MAAVSTALERVQRVIATATVQYRVSTLKQVSDSLDILMEKWSSTVSRTGMKYFAFVWIVFLVPFFVRKSYKRYQAKKRTMINREIEDSE